jgi:hypothetical protein
MGLLATYIVLALFAGFLLLSLVAGVTREWTVTRNSLLVALALLLLGTLAIASGIL